MVSNAEVWQLLEESTRSAENATELINGERRTKPRAPQPGLRELRTLQEQTLLYLGGCHLAGISEAVVSAFLEEVDKMVAKLPDPLTPAEKLQLINLRPCALVDIYLVRARARARRPVLRASVWRATRRRAKLSATRPFACNHARVPAPCHCQIVDGCERRLGGPAGCQKLLRVCKKYFPPQPTAAAPGSAEAMEEDAPGHHHF